MAMRTVVLATTERRLDGQQFTVEQLLKMAEYLNKWGPRKYNKDPMPLPYFDGYPGYTLRAWVTIPFPGAPSVLYVEGYLTNAFEQALTAGSDAGLQQVILPFALPREGE